MAEADEVVDEVTFHCGETGQEEQCCTMRRRRGNPSEESQFFVLQVNARLGYDRIYTACGICEFVLIGESMLYRRLGIFKVV